MEQKFENKSKLPICVDLDGTLIRNDLTVWSVETFIKSGFFSFVRFIFYVIFRGWAQTKRRIAQEIPLKDMSLLKYNEKFLDYLVAQRKSGVHLFLATATDEIYAKKVAEDVGIFDGVLASNGECNLAGKTKADALYMIFGEKGFVYAGNSKDDIDVWNKCSEAILVSPTKATIDGMRDREYMLFE